MNPHIWQMSLNELGVALLIGAICAVIYLYLLWRTVVLLPRVKHKGLFLFVSVVLRIFLLLAVMKLLAGDHAGRFILMACGFFGMRLFILRFTRFGAYNREEDKQLKKALNKKKGRR